MNIRQRFSEHYWQYPILVTSHEKPRSSRPEVSCKKGVFENFANQRCFPVNFVKFSRTSFLMEDFRSSNINEVIRAVLNFLLFFFFYEKILHAQKAQKRK